MNNCERLAPFTRQLTGYLLTADHALQELIKGLWTADRILWTVYESGKSALENLFTDPPDLLVVDNAMPDMPGAELVNLLKSENVYRQVPVVLCLTPKDMAACLNWSSIEADDFLLLPCSSDEARARLSLTLCRASRNLDANPLSRLPGNTTIIQRIQELIDTKQDFALAYADLDYFKSFNDKYGFSRGDEALLMTARIIVNTIRGFSSSISFVGHIGGDDFVFILPPEIIEQACQQVVDRFDAIIPNCYDPEDQERGFIRSTDRKGNLQEFPIMAISVAVVLNIGGRLKHFGEVSQIASALKKKAKENPKSCYVVDRRASPTA
jgi:diguanylate cyclase (GGDEF)-like protein